MLEEIQIGLNFPDPDGYMLIHYAIAANKKEVVEELASSAFLDLDNLPVYAKKIKKNILPQSPLDFSLNNHHFELAELLYNKGRSEDNDAYRSYAPYTGLMPYSVIAPRIHDREGLAWLEAKTENFVTNKLTNIIQVERACQIGDLDKFKKFIEANKDNKKLCIPAVALGLLSALQYHKHDIIKLIINLPKIRT